MSKLSDLKEWVLPDEAAQHLSIAFGEKVTKADVFKLALDGRLTLSVDIVNPLPALLGRFVRMPEIEVFDTFRSREQITGIEMTGPVAFAPFKAEAVRIRGVFDLKMVGGNLWSVLAHHQHLTQGPTPRRGFKDGSGRVGVVLEAEDVQQKEPFMALQARGFEWRHTEPTCRSREVACRVTWNMLLCDAIHLH